MDYPVLKGRIEEEAIVRIEKTLLTFEEIESEMALELPERRLLQCNGNSGICANVGPITITNNTVKVCVVVRNC